MWDPDTPKAAKWAVVLWIIYALFPADFLPDIVLPFGIIDDIALLIAVISFFLRQTEKLR